MQKTKTLEEILSKQPCWPKTKPSSIFPKLTWWQHVKNIFWFIFKSKKQRRIERIAKMQDAIADVFQWPKADKNYEAYDSIVDEEYLCKLLNNIARGETPSIRVSIKIPRVIGLWSDEPDWGISPKRIDSEREYFACRYHAMASYIDEDWSEEEKTAVWQYLHDSKKETTNIHISVPFHQPGLEGYEGYRIVSDGNFNWHESLEDYILKYNVRPPQFFVDYILSKAGKEQKSSEYIVKEIT